MYFTLYFFRKHRLIQSLMDILLQILIFTDFEAKSCIDSGFYFRFHLKILVIFISFLDRVFSFLPHFFLSIHIKYPKLITILKPVIPIPKLNHCWGLNSIIIVIDQIFSFVITGCQVLPFDKTTSPIQITDT